MEKHGLSQRGWSLRQQNHRSATGLIQNDEEPKTLRRPPKCDGILPTGGKKKILPAPGWGAALLHQGALFLEHAVAGGVTEWSCCEQKNTRAGGGASHKRRLPTSVWQWCLFSTDVWVLQQRGRPKAGFRFEVGLAGIDGVGTSKISGRAGELTAGRRGLSARWNLVNHLRTEGKEFNSVHIHSGSSCWVLMLGFRLL